MLGNPHEDLSNAFTNDNIVEYEVEYLIEDRFYRYSVSYDCLTKQYLKEQILTLKPQTSNPSVVSTHCLLSRNYDEISISGVRQVKELTNLLSNINSSPLSQSSHSPSIK